VESPEASLCQILSKLVFLLWRFFRILKMAAAARIETHQHAKYRQNRSIGCEDLKIFLDFSRGRLPPSCIFKFYWLAVSGGPRSTHHCTKFRKVGRSVAEILRFFEFSRWPSQPSWILDIAKFYWLTESRGSRHISMPNFVKIGQLVANILRFFNFSRWRPFAILGLFGIYLDQPQRVLGVSITLQNLILINAVFL